MSGYIYTTQQSYMTYIYTVTTCISHNCIHTPFPHVCFLCTTTAGRVRKLCARRWGGAGDVRYGILRAAAGVDFANHHEHSLLTHSLGLGCAGGDVLLANAKQELHPSFKSSRSALESARAGQHKSSPSQVNMPSHTPVHQYTILTSLVIQ